MDSPQTLNIFIAFAFGLLSFLSPCVLPLLPGYLSCVAGFDTMAGGASLRGRALKNGTAFVLGFSLLFIAMGAAAGGFGQWLSGYKDVLMRVAGGVVFLMGLHISEIVPIRLLFRHWQSKGAGASTGLPGSFLLGLSFAAGWTPCVGPVLASILLMAGSTETATDGAILLAFYAAGLAAPFLLAAWGIESIHKWMGRARRVLPYVNAVSGGLLMAVGILLLTGIWPRLTRLFY